MLKTPPLYATGLWRVIPPYSVNTQRIYVCQALETFQSLEQAGVDIYTRYYLPYGLTPADYEADVQKHPTLITLLSETEPSVSFPNTYLEAYPDVTTVPYHHTVLSFSLGAIPSTLMLSSYKDDLVDLTQHTLGIDIAVKTHQVGGLFHSVDHPTHRTLEQARLTKMQSHATLRAQLTDQSEQLTVLREQNRLLIETLQTNGLLN